MAVAKNQWRRPSNHKAASRRTWRRIELGFRSGLEVITPSFWSAWASRSNTDHEDTLRGPESRHRIAAGLPPGGVLVETWGKLEQKDRVKHLLISSPAPRPRHPLRLPASHDPIVKGSKTTHAMWADKTA